MKKEAEIAASDVRLAQADRQSAAEIAATVAKRDEARAARDEKLRAEVAAMRIMIDEWQHARDRRDRYARQLLPLARERTVATLTAYRGAKATLTDVLTNTDKAMQLAKQMGVGGETEAPKTEETK